MSTSRNSEKEGWRFISDVPIKYAYGGFSGFVSRIVGIYFGWRFIKLLNLLVE